MKKRYDAVVVTGKYTDGNGKEKNRYLTVGAVFENEHGHLSMKLEAIPLVGFTGWVNFYSPKEKSSKPAQQTTTEQQPKADEFDDDIPF